MKLKGFTLFEVLIYLGIFFLIAGALFSFSWDVLDLGGKSRVSRHVFSDARFVSERLKTLIRDASDIDTAASVWDDANGRLILHRPDSSDTITIDIQNGIVTLTETGQSPIALHSADTRTVELRFVEYGSQADASHYVDFVLGCESVESNAGTRAVYDAVTSLRSGAALRNISL